MQPDDQIDLSEGRRHKLPKRTLAAWQGMTPDQQRAYRELEPEHAMVAPNQRHETMTFPMHRTPISGNRPPPRRPHGTNERPEPIS